jgi:hypothetical protein
MKEGKRAAAELKKAAAKRPIKWSPIDIGTFVWYKGSIRSGVKALILLMCLELSDNPPLGTIASHSYQ